MSIESLIGGGGMGYLIWEKGSSAEQYTLS